MVLLLEWYLINIVFLIDFEEGYNIRGKVIKYYRDIRSINDIWR